MSAVEKAKKRMKEELEEARIHKARILLKEIDATKKLLKEKEADLARVDKMTKEECYGFDDDPKALVGSHWELRDALKVKYPDDDCCVENCC